MDTDDNQTPPNPPPPPPGSLGIGPGGDGLDQTIKVNVPARGTMVFGRYKLDRILGRGGMGVVWLAHDTKLERDVALKFLPNLIGLDPGAVKELKTETRRGLELSHPNIVRIYDFVDDDDAAAISMEYVDGRTLSELRIETPSGVFGVDEVAKWLPGVCDALDYAHQQRKLVHRDLKPANIMLTKADEVAKVADFGIARSLSDTMSRLSAAQVGTSGTLPYMSPQQAMGDKPGPTDDVYSLGATIYEVLAGKPPFYQGDIATQINNKVPPSMIGRRDELEIQVPTSIPKAWEDAIAACLSKEPFERPQSAGELAVMLGLKPAASVTLSTKTARALAANEAAAKSKKPLWIGVGAGVAALAAAAFFFKPSGSPDEAPAVAKAATVEEEAVAQPEAKPPGAGKAGAPEPTPVDSPKSDAKPKEVAEAKPAPKSGSKQSPPAPKVVAKSEGTQGDQAELAEPEVPTPPTSVEPALNSAVAVAQPGQAAPMSLTPDGSTGGTTLVIPAQPNQPRSQPQTIVLPPGTVLPPGAVIVQSPPGEGQTSVTGAQMAVTPETSAQAEMPKQPVVGEPPEGHWKLPQLFPSPPFAMYSDNGKRHLLFEAQKKLKDKGLYSSTVDGKEGKNTHNAILLFQAKNSLIPNGLLDYPTLAKLEMQKTEDDKEWKSPASRYSGSNYRRASPEREEPNFLQRTGNKLRGLFD
jgi:hypothetical protein